MLKTILVWISRAIMLASLFFVGRLMFFQWEAVSALFTAGMYKGLAISAAVMLLSAMVGAENWFHVMGGSVTVSRRIAFGVLLTTQIAKYIPGNFGVFFGRPYLAHKFGIPSAKVLGSVFLEVVFVAGFTAIICLFLAHDAFLVLQQQGLVNFSIPVWAAVPLGILILLILPLLPGPLNWGLSKFNVKNLLFPEIPLKIYSVIAALNLLQYLLIGFANWMILRTLFPDENVSFSLCTVANVVAIFAGFISPGAPAGLGVREAVLLVLFRPQIGEVGAVAFVALSRFLNIGVDIITSGIAWASLPQTSHFQNETREKS